MGNINFTSEDVELLEAMLSFEQAYDSMVTLILNQYNERLRTIRNLEERQAIMSECADRLINLKMFYDNIYAIVDQL